MNQDTIAAISTGMTNSGIGIVRISGSEALEIADRVYKGKETITEVPTHTIHYGHVMDGDETVDEVLVMVMRGPRTFTGEDTVEINCHGGTYVVSRVLETVLKAGARPAEPGEFTKRAFLNGKMDLSQAEAVIDVITSENEYALQSSISQLKGSVKNRIKEIREKIIYHTSFTDRCRSSSSVFLASSTIWPTTGSIVTGLTAGPELITTRISSPGTTTVPSAGVVRIT